MERIQVLESILGLSGDREALLREAFLQTLFKSEDKEHLLYQPLDLPEANISERSEEVSKPSQQELAAPSIDYDWSDTFSVGACFSKRKSLKGKEPITVAIVKVEGINVWFDVDFRCKAWKNSSRKRTMDSAAARLFLEEFKRS